jgi:hypothetical protein
MLNKLHLVHVRKELHKELVAHLLPHAGQHHSVHKNECEDHVYFLTQYIVTNIIVEIVNYNFFCIIVRYTTLLLSVLQTVYFQCLQVFWLCMKSYLIYSPGGP